MEIHINWESSVFSLFLSLQLLGNCIYIPTILNANHFSGATNTDTQKMWSVFIYTQCVDSLPVSSDFLSYPDQLTNP